MALKQFLLTSSMGKRLIGRGMAAHPAVKKALADATLAILGGTTNGYVAEEVLRQIGQADGFTRKGFRRGMTTPPTPDAEPVAAEFAGDVIVREGKWDRGKTISDVAGELTGGDVIVKGGNALDLCQRRAAVYIGHPAGGTIAESIPAIVGKRAKLIVPIGLEKRIASDVADVANRLNDPSAQGPRMMPLPGDVFTELDAIGLLTGASAELVAAGGVYGAEGSVYLAVSGTAEQVAAAERIIQDIADEPPCRV